MSIPLGYFLGIIVLIGIIALLVWERVAFERDVAYGDLESVYDEHAEALNWIDYAETELQQARESVATWIDYCVELEQKLDIAEFITVKTAVDGVLIEASGPLEALREAGLVEPARPDETTSLDETVGEPQQGEPVAVAQSASEPEPAVQVDEPVAEQPKKRTRKPRAKKATATITPALA